MKQTPACCWVLVLALTTLNCANAQLLISEYVEGSSNNKAIELWNTTSTNVTFGTNAGQLNVMVSAFANGSGTSTAEITLTPGYTLKARHVYVLANSSASFGTNADQTTGSVNWNGDDAITLTADGVLLDSIGQVGFDPGAEWGAGLASTADNTLRRAATNLVGDVNTADAYDPAVSFTGFALDSFDHLGVPPDGAILEIQRVAGDAILSWTALAQGYTLQFATNSLGVGTVWSNTSEVPVVLNKRSTVTNNLQTGNKYYRLFKP